MNISLLSAHTNFDAAPDGLNAFVVRAMGLTDVHILDVRDRERLYKVVTFVPPEFREQVLEAMFKAGAGHIGAYADTSFRATGTGTFRPLPGSHPFTGKEHVLARVEEDRVETIVPGRSLASVLDALRSAHPYEEPAVDIFEEHLPEVPVAGFGHVGRLPHVMDPQEFTSFIKSFLVSRSCRWQGHFHKPSNVLLFVQEPDHLL